MTAYNPQFDITNAVKEKQLDQHFAARNITLANGSEVVIRENNASEEAPVLVCLHGIGSGAASWLDMACLLAPKVRVIAWDAPGYGDSTALATSTPFALDYASQLQELLQSLSIDSFYLVGHSLGALIASAYMQLDGAIMPQELILISPAIGYGDPALAERREQVLQHRLANWQGAADMANKRAAFLLSDQASTEAVAWVHWNMSRLHDEGYKQAVWMLCNDDLLGYAQKYSGQAPVHVWCGENDQITPLAQCEKVAEAFHTPIYAIPIVGHAGYVEQPSAVGAKIESILFEL